MSTNTELIARSERVASELDDHNANMDRRARTCIRELVTAIEALEAENASITNDALKFVAERDALQAEVERLKRGESMNEWVALITENGELRAEVETTKADFKRQEEYSDSLQDRINALQAQLAASQARERHTRETLHKFMQAAEGQQK